MQVGDVPKYDCSMDQPLSAKEAERLVRQELDAGRLGETNDGAPGSSTPGSFPAASGGRQRMRCFNCGSYLHSLRDCLQACGL
jgi:hypothetical protein